MSLTGTLILLTRSKKTYQEPYAVWLMQEADVSLFNPESDQHLSSPNFMTPESHSKVMTIKEMITN